MTKCGKTCEVWSRVVGYHRPTTNYNKGKIEEFNDRKEFDLQTSLNHKVNQEQCSCNDVHTNKTT
jgi:ribonucleoside-triphosphate reductase